MRIGFYPPGIIDKHQRCLLNLAGNIRINGNGTIGAGSRIEVAQKAVLEFLGIVDNSAAVSIECQDRITIGGGTVISWDVLIMDDDFHFIQDIETGLTNKRHKPIVIG